MHSTAQFVCDSNGYCQFTRKLSKNIILFIYINLSILEKELSYEIPFINFVCSAGECVPE